MRCDLVGTKDMTSSVARSSNLTVSLLDRMDRQARESQLWLAPSVAMPRMRGTVETHRSTRPGAWTHRDGYRSCRNLKWCLCRQVPLSMAITMKSSAIVSALRIAR